MRPSAYAWRNFLGPVVSALSSRRLPTTSYITTPEREREREKRESARSQKHCTVHASVFRPSLQQPRPAAVSKSSALRPKHGIAAPLSCGLRAGDDLQFCNAFCGGSSRLCRLQSALSAGPGDHRVVKCAVRCQCQLYTSGYA